MIAVEWVGARSAAKQLCTERPGESLGSMAMNENDSVVAMNEN
jgi:hypothetical protein